MAIFYTFCQIGGIYGPIIFQIGDFLGTKNLTNSNKQTSTLTYALFLFVCPPSTYSVFIFYAVSFDPLHIMCPSFAFFQTTLGPTFTLCILAALYLLFMAIFYFVCVNYLPSLCPCFTLSLSTLYLLCAHSLLFVSQLLHMPSKVKSNELTFTLCVSTLYTFCVHLLLSRFPPSPSFNFCLSNIFLFCVAIFNILRIRPVPKL